MPAVGFADLRQARDDLRAGRITPDEAAAVRNRDPRPLYRWPDFRPLRAKRLGAVCTSCGTTTGPFVLQHLKQPLRPEYVLDNLSERAARTWQKANPPPELDDPGSPAARTIREAYADRFEAECAPTYEREAVLKVLNSEIAYLEGALVTTMCKRCAYLEDADGLIKSRSRRW